MCGRAMIGRSASHLEAKLHHDVGGKLKAWQNANKFLIASRPPPAIATGKILFNMFAVSRHGYNW